jgi:N-carbamoyl-L-amino-acid hydrolase
MVNAKNVLRYLDELRALTADEDGAQRVAWSPTWLKAREWFEQKLSALRDNVAPNLEHHYDAAGNHWITLPGAIPKALVIGSHLDSVPNGGWLDGCLGVLTGLEILTSVAKQYSGKPPVTIKLVDWADEEGARFGRSLFGSSAFAGTHTIAADRIRTDRNDITLESALENCGYDVDTIGDASCEQKDLAVYLELHIEQGPILEKLGLPLGVVQGTKGVERWAIAFHGQEAHSGSTPMEVRRDALAACSKLALEIRSIARKDPTLNSQSVATMGSVKTFPGIVTAVVGRCEATLDMRDLDAAVLAQMLTDAHAASERFAAEERCTVEWAKIWSIAPIPFHPILIEFCDEAIKKVVGASHQLPSGPLHDAAEVAQIGIPTVMMFVQSINGLSHNKLEDTDRRHIEQAVVAMESLAERSMIWIQNR